MNFFGSKRDYEYGIPPSKSLIAFVLPFFMFLFKVVFRASWNVDPEISKLSRPLIVIGNHPSNIDAMLMSSALYPMKINFLTASTYFRIRLIRFLLYQVGAIPKIQFHADPRAVKAMFKVLKQDGIIGILPEGSRSIDGTTLPIEESLAKFIKKTNANVIVGISHGAYLSWPRWSKSGIRRGRISLDLKVLLTSEEVAAFTVDEIYSKIISSLQYNEYEWQKHELIEYRSKAPASGLQSILHKCPACNKSWVTKSYRNILECQSCGNTALMDKHGFLHPLDESCKVFEFVCDWNAWQKEDFDRDFENGEIIIKDEAQMLVSYHHEPFKLLGKGMIELNNQRFLFDGHLGSQTVIKEFPLSGILGISAEYGVYFDLSEDGYIYKFRPVVSQKVISFVHAVEFLRKRHHDPS
jgi:transcription elongation factor Elf1